MDLWFCRHGGYLWAVTANHDEPPNTLPRRIKSVKSAVSRLRANGHKIVQVGILPPDMIGLEDVEV